MGFRDGAGSSVCSAVAFADKLLAAEPVPKENGNLRPISIPALEDKIVQRPTEGQTISPILANTYLRYLLDGNRRMVPEEPAPALG